MRTFHIAFIVFISFAAAYSMGCGGEDDNCGSTSGCEPPPETCGDDACQAGMGENAQNCPEDCEPSTCGDGTCSSADGETAENCEADCNVTCLQADEPVYCGDTNSCWPAGTDCDLPTYACGGETMRCLPEQAENQVDSQISCCGGVYVDCASQRPYWCPEQNLCVATMEECPSAASTCELWGFSCIVTE